MSSGEFILYVTEDGNTSIQLKAQEETVWLTRMEIAELFQITPQNVTLHIKEIYVTREVEMGSTSKDYLLVQNEGGRSIRRTVKLYNLSVILSIGYRVRSLRGTQYEEFDEKRRQEARRKADAEDRMLLEELQAKAAETLSKK